MVEGKSQYQLLEEILEGFLKIGDNSSGRVNSFGRERSSTNRKEEIWDIIDQRIKLYIGEKYPHTTDGSSPVSKASSVASQLTRKCMKTYQGSESLENFEAEMEKFREKTGEKRFQGCSRSE
jgi:hypothetical protein